MEPKDIKIVIIGDSGVGKTSMATRFALDKFKNESDSTIGTTYMSKTIEVGHIKASLNIWDTAGQERYHSLAHMFYRNADVILLVYDITNS